MSVDFHAVFALGSRFASAERLRAELAEEPPGLRETIETYRLQWRAEAWTVEPCNVRPPWAKIVGPGGFSLTLSPCAASLYHLTRLSRFSGDTDARVLLRRSCRVICDLLGSSHALVMPELTPGGFFDGMNLAEMEANLRKQIGPPASTWNELHEAKHFGPRSWYLDAFTDLR